MKIEKLTENKIRILLKNEDICGIIKVEIRNLKVRGFECR